jgi:hypothetical protein
MSQHSKLVTAAINLLESRANQMLTETFGKP